MRGGEKKRMREGEEKKKRRRGEEEEGEIGREGMEKCITR